MSLHGLHIEIARLNALNQDLQAKVASLQGWKDAVIDALVVGYIYNAQHEADPRRALKELIAWEVAIALDPDVSGEAAALVKEGAKAWRDKYLELRAKAMEMSMRDAAIMARIEDAYREAAETIVVVHTK